VSAYITLDSLADAANRLRTGAELDGQARAALLEALRQVDARQFEAQLRARGRGDRNRLIRDLAAAHFGNLGSTKAKATAIAALASRYAATGWLNDQGAATCPPRLHGGPEALLWAAMIAYPRFPFSVRALEAVLK
jgi:hypothetical protein